MSFYDYTFGLCIPPQGSLDTRGGIEKDRKMEKEICVHYL